ncbi:MFS transporter [Nonomuraea purpurea]|uniref:MFS transporter n=1 Tax=Nonomuraea purpurea TaxID=1849276 RepID=A0ABV8GFG3_9ACTN
MTLDTATRPLAPTAKFPIGSLVLLGIAVFVTVTAETLPAGLMPEMAADFGVDSVQIGLLISVWALTVIVTSIPLTRLFARFDRRLVLGVALAGFAVANLATALSPDYGFAVATRVLGAVTHGVFWAIVIVYTTSLLTPKQLGRGLSIVTGGVTAAAVVGFPSGAALAQLVGWRVAFVVLATVSLLIAAAILVKMPARRPEPATTAQRSAGFRRDPSLPALLAFGAASVLIALGQYATFTYVRSYLEGAAMIDAEWSAGLLFIYGLAGLGGVAVAGFVADRFPRGGLVVATAAFAVVFAVLTFAAGSLVSVIIALVVWGAAFGAVLPLLQTAQMRAATERTRALASAGMMVLFNVGVAVGPWLGGVVGGQRAPTMTTAMSAVVMVIATVAGVVGMTLLGHRTDGRR